MNSWIPSHIQVTVIQARDLALKSKNVHSEVYAIVQVDKEREVTHLLPRHTCPRWNQSFDIPLMSLDSSVSITVRQKSKFSDEYIGYINIPFTGLSISRRRSENWYKLVSKPGKISTKIRGDVLVATSFLSKWEELSNDTETHFDVEVEEKKMLRRTKSEYKGRAKESPKQEKPAKTKGIFSRSLRKKNSQVFEDSDDFIALSVPGMGGNPPTPPQSERKQLSLPSEETDSDKSLDSSNEARRSSPNHLLFTEATQLERNGIIDLMRADPQLRRETVKQLFREGRSTEPLNNTESPMFHSLRRHRAASMYSSSPGHRRQDTSSKQSSFDSSYEEEPVKQPTSTPTTPERSQTITYRAKSTPRRRDRPNSASHSNINQERSLTPQVSNTSIDSTTSEYYSGSSAANTPSTSNTTVFIDGETTPTNISPKASKKLDAVPVAHATPTGDPVKRTLNTETGRVESSRISTARHGKLRRGATVDRTSSSATLPRLRPQAGLDPVDASLWKRHPVEGADSEKLQVRHLKRHVTEGDTKRHSADIAQILKLSSSSSQTKHDGLENVLNTGQLRQLLRKSSSGRGPLETETKPDTSVSDKVRPSPLKTGSSGSHLVVESVGKDTEATPTIELDLSSLSDSTLTDTTSPNTDSPNNGRPDTLGNDKSIQEMTAKKNSPTESRISSTSADPSNTVSLTDQPNQIDVSAYSHDMSNSVPDVTISADSSRSTTPSQMSPPLSSTDVTRETTPSPDHEEETDGPSSELVKGTGEIERKKMKHTVELKKSDGKKSFQPFQPLPPSIASMSSNSTSSSLTKWHSSATDITSLLNQCKDVIPTANLETPANVIRPSSQCSHPYSTASSGRTSPVILEEEEERNENLAPITSPPPPPSSHRTPPSVQPAQSSRNSNSLPRRKQGGGLRRTLSMYQENRRQVTVSKERKALVKQNTLGSATDRGASKRGNTTDRTSKKCVPSVDKPSDGKVFSQLQKSLLHQKPADNQNNPGKATVSISGQTLGASFTASKTVGASNHHSLVSKQSVDSSSPSLSSHETQHSIQSQTNSAASSIPGTPVSEHFALPPPPPLVVRDDFVAELHGNVMTAGEQGNVASDTVSDSTASETAAVSDAPSTCSEDNTSSEIEELTDDDLQGWSKEALILELVRTRSKLKSRTMELNDMNNYMENLLVKVMDQHPELLLSDSH